MGTGADNGFRKVVDFKLEFRDESTLSVHFRVNGDRISGPERVLTLQRAGERIVAVSLQSGETFVATFGEHVSRSRSMSILLQGAGNQKAQMNPRESRASFRKISCF